MRSKNKIEFHKARVILCEGSSDAAFFRKLIADRRLPDAHVICAADITNRHGKDGFSSALTGFSAAVGFSSVKEVVIVADCDDDYNKSFQRVKSQIETLAQRDEFYKLYSIPERPQQKSINHAIALGISITVLMIPWHDKNGALETLLFEAASQRVPQVRDCLSDFMVCCKIHEWPEQKKAKMLIRTLLSASYQKNPDIGLGRVWIENPELIPVSHAAFDQISDFLANL